MFSFILLAAGGVVGSLIYYSPMISRVLSTSALRQKVKNNRVLALTYDDGPSKTVTPSILNILKSYDAKATFFMLGRSADQHPAVADRIVREGHDVGCHSDQHFNAWKVMPWRAIADINNGYTRLAPWIASNGMFRPPYGKVTLPTFLMLRRRTAPICWWTVVSGDTYKEIPRPFDVANAIIRRGGGVVLMHDFDRTKDRNDFVLETTAILLETAKRESFQVKRLSEL